MTSLEILSLPLGLALIFLVLSLLTTSLSEGIAEILRLRSKNLELHLRQLLDSEEDTQGRFQNWHRFWTYRHPKRIAKYLQEAAGGSDTVDLLQNFYGHEVTRQITDRRNHLGSYLNREVFSEILITLLPKEGLEKEEDEPSRARAIKAHLKEKGGGLGMAKALDQATDHIADIRNRLERWFDLTMEKASERYKRNIQRQLFVLGFLVAMVFNADTLHMVKTLIDKPKMVEMLAHRAEAFADVVNEDDEQALYAQALLDAELKTLEFHGLLGWSEFPDSATEWKKDMRIFQYRPLTSDQWQYLLSRLPGWLITALAIALGSPFWFDLFQKIVNIRAAAKGAAGRKPTKYAG